MDSVVDALEKGLGQIKKDFHLSDTLKWTKAPSRGQYQEGYKQFLSAFLEEHRWYFRCIVVDTQRYPLDHPMVMSGDPLVGYLKFYCTFLADGLMKNKTDYFCDIRIDRYSFRVGNGSSDLQRSVQGRFIKKASNNKYDDYCKVTVLDSSAHNLLQMTDLLVGAVAFVWNGGMSKSSAHAEAKKALVQFIQEKRGIDLSRPSKAWEHGFNIWEFRAK